LKIMRLPGVNRDAGGLVDQMRDTTNGNKGWRTAQEKGQVAFAVGMGAYWLVQPVNRHTPERAMTDGQGRAHQLPPDAHIIVFAAI
jgi:hypothetical protein